MQLLCDLLVAFTPLALVGRVDSGVAQTLVGTGIITLFYSSLLNLAKFFLDPLDNEGSGGKYGISINVDTLLQETNLSAERWRVRAAWIPPRLSR
jgi:hypothetical protein